MTKQEPMSFGSGMDKLRDLMDYTYLADKVIPVINK